MKQNTLSWVIVGLLVIIMLGAGYFMFSGSLQCKSNPFMYGAERFSQLYDYQPFSCVIDDFGSNKYKIDCNLYSMDGEFVKVVRYVNFNYDFEKDFPIYYGSNATIPLIHKKGNPIPQINFSKLNLSS